MVAIDSHRLRPEPLLDIVGKVCGILAFEPYILGLTPEVEDIRAQKGWTRIWGHTIEVPFESAPRVGQKIGKRFLFILRESDVYHIPHERQFTEHLTTHCFPKRSHTERGNRKYDTREFGRRRVLKIASEVVFWF